MTTPEKCANCGVDIIPTGDGGYTHVPSTFATPCRDPSPVWTRSDKAGYEDRVREAEAIIRAKNRLEQAMYDSDLSVSWPRDASELQDAYERRYGVNLEGDER